MNRILNICVLVMCVSLSSCYYDNKEDLYGDIPCDPVGVSFTKDIQPLIQTECAIYGCHIQGGAGYGVFENYQNIKAKVDNGSLRSRVIVQKDMPPSNPLSECQIAHIEAWINEGALNN